MLHNRHDDFTAAPWYETYWYGGCAWCHQSHICIHSCRGTWRAAVQDARDSRRCFHVTASHSKQHQRLRRHHRCGGPLLCSQSSTHTHTLNAFQKTPPGWPSYINGHSTSTTTHVTNKSLSSHTAQINSFSAPDTLGCIWIAGHRLHPVKWVGFNRHRLHPEHKVSFSLRLHRILRIPRILHVQRNLSFPGLWPPWPHNDMHNVFA